jgi:hypothetical protein
VITNNADTIAKELDSYSAQLTKKLEMMVAGFASDVALKAAQSTSVATDDYIQKNQSLYKNRKTVHGIEIAPGFHAGSWQYAEGTLVFNSNINSQSAVQTQVEGEALANYRLGNTFYIGSLAPNIDYLEDRDNISANVTDAAARAAYASNLKMHFDRGLT